MSYFLLGISFTLSCSLAGSLLWLVVERARYYRSEREQIEAFARWRAQRPRPNEWVN